MAKMSVTTTTKTTVETMIVLAGKVILLLMYLEYILEFLVGEIILIWI